MIAIVNFIFSLTAGRQASTFRRPEDSTGVLKII